MILTLASLNRWKASAIHLGLSAVIAATVVTLMLTVWYPGHYFAAMGGTTLILLMIGVDVVIGPLVTLIVYDPRKKELKWDLAIIAIVQLAALAYGGYVMFKSRPVYNVFVVDRFDVVPAVKLDDAALAKAPPEYRSLPLTGPRVIAVRKPDDPNRQYDMSMSAMQGGPDLSETPEFYMPYAQFRDAAAKRARPLAELEKHQPGDVQLIRDFVRKSGRKAEDFGFLAMKAFERDMVVIVDAKSGEFVEILPVNPW